MFLMSQSKFQFEYICLNIIIVNYIIVNKNCFYKRQKINAYAVKIIFFLLTTIYSGVVNYINNFIHNLWIKT